MSDRITSRRAFAVLPVEPRHVRRAALRQTLIGAVLSSVGGVAAWLFVRPFLVDGSAASAGLLLAGFLAGAPLLVAVLLGTPRQRAVSRGSLSLLAGAFLMKMLGRRALGEVPFIQTAPILAVALACALSLWLVVTLLRPASDEVRGGG